MQLNLWFITIILFYHWLTSKCNLKIKVFTFSFISFSLFLEFFSLHCKYYNTEASKWCITLLLCIIYILVLIIYYFNVFLSKKQNQQNKESILNYHAFSVFLIFLSPTYFFTLSYINRQSKSYLLYLSPYFMSHTPVKYVFKLSFLMYRGIIVIDPSPFFFSTKIKKCSVVKRH